MLDVIDQLIVSKNNIRTDLHTLMDITSIWKKVEKIFLSSNIFDGH